MSEGLTIPNVPPRVTRDQVREALRLLGLDPAELAGLEFRHDAIYATVYAVDENGHRYVEAHGLSDGTFDIYPDAAAAHRLAIPIVGR